MTNRCSVIRYLRALYRKGYFCGGVMSRFCHMTGYEDDYSILKQNSYSPAL